jgi:AraC family transcriptional regulator, regulatory protein of adaptative response / DNA-3-methyladenine glycosylase II
VAALWGSPADVGHGVDRHFPSPAQLANADIERAGVVTTRATAIRSLARQIVSGTVPLGNSGDPRSCGAAIRAIPGIGDWTAAYIAMRAFGEPDAFPSGDLILRRAAGNVTARELEVRSQAWRPWRAYAVVLLWQAAGEEHQRLRRKAHEPRVEIEHGASRRVAAGWSGAGGAE